MAAEPGIRVFTGRSIEELIPEIRRELGPDAIVVRSRERLQGGIGGFFQRQVVEIEAREPLPHERGALPRNDRATAEGLASPAIAQLVSEAQPFADELAQAQRTVADRTAESLLAAHAEALAPRPDGETPDSPPAPSGLYGPQPNMTAVREAAAASSQPGAPHAAAPPSPRRPHAGADAVPQLATGMRRELAPPLPTESSPVAAPRQRAAGSGRFAGAAAELERRLVASGLSADLAADVVAEAVVHHGPFAGSRQLPQLVRRVLASRIRVLGDVGGAPRALAFAGAAGSGKTAACANLAVAYVAAGARAAVFALGGPEHRIALAARLEPLGIPVHGAADADVARAALDRLDADLAVFDTPALGLGDEPAMRALAAQLRALALDEVHLTLPAPLSAAAAVEVRRALRPLGITHAALTHIDATAHPGAAVEAALVAGLPLSYLCSRATLAPADPLELAARLA